MVPVAVKRTQPEARVATKNHISREQEAPEEGEVVGDLIAPPFLETGSTREALDKESMQTPLPPAEVEAPDSRPLVVGYGVCKSTGSNRKIPVEVKVKVKVKTPKKKQRVSKTSSFLHDDGGLQNLLPTLEEQLEELKNTKAPAMSTQEQLDVLWKHSRRTDRENKKHGLISSRFSNESVKGVKNRVFLRVVHQMNVRFDVF